jgi:site-specific DNA recombinase
VHTETGFNIGKPCYGYQADKVPHPVPVKRGKGIKKTFLQPDPDQAPVVQRIFAWRVTERLGYQAIADRLNTDRAMNPAPVPVRADAAVGHWTYSNVRDVLTNPKHTGHMVWNRHARKNGHNRANPVQAWVWSPQPVHEPLISMEQFIAAQEVSGHRFGSRSTHAANSRHRQTRRSYRLRTYLFCELCGRRMYGKTRRGHGYYVCAPKKGYVPDGHPGAGSFWIREQALLAQLGEFLNQRVFGPDRETLLRASLDRHQDTETTTRAERISALRRAITDTEARRLVRNLELIDDPDQDFIRDINTRRAELRGHKLQLETDLDQLETQAQQAPNPDLLTALPLGQIDLEHLPEDLTRRLFELLRLEIRYDRNTNQARYRITLGADTIHAAHDTAQQAVVLPFARPTHGNRSRTDGTTDTSGQPPVPILVVPPAGFEPATPGLGVRRSIP